MFLFPKKAPKVSAAAEWMKEAAGRSQYELSDEVKEQIRAEILQKERLFQRVRAVKEYEVQVRAEIRIAQGYACTCCCEWADGCDVHDEWVK